MPRLFICYSSKDLPFIEELRTHLSALPDSVQVWYDRRIGVGDDWPDHLRRELDNSTHLLACLSSDMIASKWCQGEWSHAYDHGKPVFPLRVREVSVPRVPHRGRPGPCGRRHMPDAPCPTPYQPRPTPCRPCPTPMSTGPSPTSRGHASFGL